MVDKTDASFPGMEQLQASLSKEFTGEAGAGMVKVTITGDMKLVDVHIDHTVFGKTAPALLDDLSFISDMFKAATNQAIKTAAEAFSETLVGSITGP